MWLINTITLELREHLNSDVPPYAILSHRWAATTIEVSFKEYRKNLKVTTSSYFKIRDFCKAAREDGLDWAWADTCCIDKRSSAELSESINSMFAWYRDARTCYRDARTCYVYLTDVGKDGRWQDSRWWKRGWTLQELIAPARVIFYDGAWRKIGTKHTLAEQIEQISGVPTALLKQQRALTQWSIAQRLSWAAGRRTSREEDRAYSLLGLFRIEMALLYGEGAKAFRRLQLEILQKYPDKSIFAWQAQNRSLYSPLATSPDDFRNSWNMAAVNLHDELNFMPIDPDPRRIGPARITSWGIELRANARRLQLRRQLNVGGKAQKFLWAITLATA